MAVDRASDAPTMTESAPGGGPTLTERLASALAPPSPAPIDAATLTVARRFVLDWLACALAGVATPAGRILIDEGRGRGAGPSATIGVDAGRDAEVAALVNGGLSHIVEMDDLHRASVVHPGCVVIPAALAVGEETGASGRDLTEAIVAGYEAAIRVGEAVGRSHYAYWHNTATCGAFGSAAAAGRLLGLDAGRVADAFGNAGSIAGGLWQFNHDGAMTKPLHAGRAAANGVLAARLAARGLTGARAILEGPQGLFAAMSRDPRPERVVDGLDSLGAATPWRIGGVSIKPHAACRHTHPAIDAALALRRAPDGHDLDAIERIEVATYSTALAVTDSPDPRTAAQAKFSLQYVVARAFLAGRVSLLDFDESSLLEPGVRDLMRRTRLAVDPAFDAAYPARWGAVVRGVSVDGSIREARVETPKGDPENALSDDELRRKVDDLLAGTNDAGRADEIARAVESLDAQPAVRGWLMDVLRRG